VIMYAQDSTKKRGFKGRVYRYARRQNNRTFLRVIKQVSNFSNSPIAFSGCRKEMSRIMIMAFSSLKVVKRCHSHNAVGRPLWAW
jgi:hypothetical protein